MGYTEAMEAAGATILNYEEFGSYQGDWWAKVSYEGRVFWVHGSFGSCSGCDAFQAEFGYGHDEECSEHRYEYPPPENCPNCDQSKAAYQIKLAEFGKSYLFSDLTQEEAEKEANPYDWDSDGKEALKFVQKNAI